MSFFSITFSSDSSQEVLLPVLTQLKAMTGTSGTTFGLEGAPPSLSELEAMTGTSGATFGLEGAPPPLPTE